MTGDTHAGWMERLNTAAFPEQKEMTKDDYVIILGDFGIWDDSKREKYGLDWLEKKSFTTLFIDGNHENYDMLDAMPEKRWNGGKVHVIRPTVMHLMRRKHTQSRRTRPASLQTTMRSRRSASVPL